MNYRMTLFWSAILILDYFLLAGLPPTQQAHPVHQARLEPAHCWDAVYNARHVAIVRNIDPRIGPCLRNKGQSNPTGTPRKDRAGLPQSGLLTSGARSQVSESLQLSI